MVRQYNNIAGGITKFFVLLFVCFALTFGAAEAQEIASRSIRQNIEKFEQYVDTDPNKALTYAKAVADEVEDNVMSVDIAKIFDFLSNNYEYTEHLYRIALDYRLRAMVIYEMCNDQVECTRNYAHAARLYLRNSDYHNAFSYSKRAYNMAEELGDRLSMREAILTIEQVEYFYNGDTEEAMNYNVRVADEYEGSAEAHQTARALNNRFNYDLTPDQMYEVLNRTKSICDEYGFTDILLNVYLNMSLQELRFADFEASEHYLALAKPLISNFKEEGYYYSASAFYNINRDNNNQAIVDIIRSIELLGAGDFDSKNVHSYFLLQDIYRTQGRYKAAYEALMRFAELYTQQHNTENIVELSALINQLELEQAEQAHRERQKEYEQERRMNSMMWKIYIAGLILIVALGVLLLSRYRLQRKNHKLLNAKAEQEINYKSEIIKIQRLQQFEEMKNHDAIIEELNAVVNSTDIREMRSELRRVIRHLQSNDTSGGDWAEVEKTLVSNDTFFDNLLKEYPNLTKNERKLCTFIHMNLSTKEIAKITHQSTGSINVARSRLRQKFGLTDSDTSLIAFLDKFKTPAE